MATQLDITDESSYPNLPSSQVSTPNSQVNLSNRYAPLLTFTDADRYHEPPTIQLNTGTTGHRKTNIYNTCQKPREVSRPSIERLKPLGKLNQVDRLGTQENSHLHTLLKMKIEEIRAFCKEVLGCGDNLFVNRAHSRQKQSCHRTLARRPGHTLNHVSCKNLEEHGYIVHRDYPEEIRQKRAKLVKVRAEVECVTGRRKMPLVFDHLTIEGCRVTWDEGKLRAGAVDGGIRLKEVVGRDFSQFLGELQEDSQQKEAAAPGGGGGGGVPWSSGGSDTSRR
ncbi:hypothetical protein J6590_086877 [Homalodisca vitripennis]|nr:hypothetical protein J6590_086877 [Homalodisca vitripennis]